jgi:hypothetical protein
MRCMDRNAATSNDHADATLTWRHDRRAGSDAQQHYQEVSRRAGAWPHVCQFRWVARS